MKNLQIGETVTVVNDGTEERCWMAGRTGQIYHIDGGSYWIEFPPDNYAPGPKGCYSEDDLSAAT